MAIEALGWEYKEPRVFIDDDGSNLRILEMSPAMLWKYMLRTRRRQVENGLDKKLQDKERLMENQEVQWQAVVRAANRLEGRERSHYLCSSFGGLFLRMLGSLIMDGTLNTGVHVDWKTRLPTA